MNLVQIKFVEEIQAAAVEAVADVMHEIKSNGLRQDDGNYNEQREDTIRDQMQQFFHYAESGPTFDPAGKYLCGSCYYRQLMDWGDTDKCYIVDGTTKMDIGSCGYYKNGTPDAEWNPLPILRKYSQVESMYAERPEAKAFGCSRCEYADKAKKPDSKGRKSWCKFFGVHIRKLACCTMEDGKDMKTPEEIKAGGPGSGRHSEGYQPEPNTQEATDWHNEALKQAKEELGDDAPIGKVLQRAAEIQKAGKKLDAGGPGSGCNPEVGTCGPHPQGIMHDQVGQQKGSNPGGLFRGEDGVLRYVKLYSSPHQAASELVANAVYQGLGVNVPKTQMFEHDGKFGIATNIVEGKTLKEAGITKETAASILKDFAVDVLTNNWDAVGLEHDNVIMNKFNNAVRIDQGGALLSRAKGGFKPEYGLNSIDEVHKLLDPSVNPAYSKVAQQLNVKSYNDVLGFKAQVEKIVDFDKKYPGGWKGYVNNILDTMGGKDISKDIRDKIGNMLEARTKALNNLVNQKKEAPTQVGETVKGVAQFKKQVDSTVKSFVEQYGAKALGVTEEDNKGFGSKLYKSSQPETPRDKLFKTLGFTSDQLQLLHKNMANWSGGANDTTRNAAREVLSGKPKTDMGRLWYVESKITQAFLGPGKIKLYRGVKGPQADQLYAASKDPSGPKTLFKVLLSPANSWSDDPKIAKSFGSGKVYLRKNMPTKFIMTTYKNNQIMHTRHPSEHEFLCMTPEKGVSMKRSNLLNAAKQKVVVIDLRKGINDAWLHNRRKQKNIRSAIDVSQKGQFAGSLWNHIRVVGFSGPEEEGLRAMLSRVPPELLYNVSEFRSAKELGVKHGRFVPDTKTIMYNPRNFIFRQRFGKGPGWVQHAEMTAVHEVGHSIYESFTPEQKQEWQDCSGWVKGHREGNLPPYVEVRPGWPQETSKWTHKPGIGFTRHYAERNPNEDFADSFAFFILGKGFQMEPAKRTFLENLMKAKVKQYPQVTIQSPIAPYFKQEAIRKAQSV